MNISLAELIRMRQAEEHVKQAEAAASRAKLDYVHGASGHAFCIFGMSVPVLLALRDEYMLRCGLEPMTEESVRETFGRGREGRCVR